MIAVCTLNPAMTHELVGERFFMYETNYTQKDQLYVDDSAVNQCRIFKELRCESALYGFAAGFVGEQIVASVKQEKLKEHFVRVHEGNSRINVVLRGIKDTKIINQGPSITSDEIKEFFDQLIGLKESDTLILCGDVPPSMPENFYQTVLGVVSANHVRCVVEAADEWLLKVLEYQPFLIKTSQAQLEVLFQTRIYTLSELIEAARKLKAMGAVNVLVSRGKLGAVLIDEEDQALHCLAELGECVSLFGCEDALLAGFMAAYLDLHNYAAALKLGVAAYKASAMVKGLAEHEAIRTCYEQFL